MSDTDVLSVKITGDESGLKKALDNGIRELKRFSKHSDNFLKRIEHNTGGAMLYFQKLTVSIHGIVNAFKAVSGMFGFFVHQAQDIDQMSRRLGIARVELEMLKYAAEQSGFSIETVADAMKSFSNVLGAANIGDEEAKNKLFSVGIDSETFDGKGISEQFDMLADHIASIEDPAERARVAMELFGESGFQLLPMLEKGSAGLRDLKQEALDSGSIMGEEACASALSLSDSIAKLQATSRNLANEILATFAPSLASMLSGLSKLLKHINKFIEAHPIMSKILITMLTSVLGLATAVKILTAAFAGLNIATGGLIALAGVLTTALLLMVSYISSTSNQTDEIKKQQKEMERLRQTQEASAKAEQKRAEAARKVAEATKKAQDAQKAVVDAEKSLADSGKSSAQKEVEKIDEDITTFKSNWHTRKNWLRQQANKRKLTKEEQTELDSMTPERYYDYINAQKRRQNEIRSGLSHRDYQPENPESDAVRAAQDNLDALRARGASAPEVAQAEKAVKEAEMRFTQVALQSSGQEKEQARRDYLAAKEAYENSGDKNEFEQEALYKAMVEAQKKSQEADANFTRLAEQNYKMYEVKMPEYEYKSVGGTFNAFAVAALGADIPKQQLEVLQQVAGKMDDIINNQQEAGVFA